MADAPKRCPKCHLEWGVAVYVAAKPAAENRPAMPTRYRCDACYHRWTGED